MSKSARKSARKSASLSWSDELTINTLLPLHFTTSGGIQNNLQLSMSVQT